MQEKLTYYLEGMLLVTGMASFILAGYVMMALSNMPQ